MSDKGRKKKFILVVFIKSDESFLSMKRLLELLVWGCVYLLKDQVCLCCGRIWVLKSLRQIKFIHAFELVYVFFLLLYILISYFSQHH